jgi:hypothetical protein
MKSGEFIIYLSRTWFFGALEDEHKEIELSFIIKIFDILRKIQMDNTFPELRNHVSYDCLGPSTKVEGLDSSDVILIKFHT